MNRMFRKSNVPAAVVRHSCNKIIRQICVAICTLTLCVQLSPAQTASVTGRVVDAVTHEPVVGATITLLELGQRKSTTVSGLFAFEQLPPGRYTVAVHHISYTDKERSVICSPENRDSIIFDLQPGLLQSDEVIVRSTRTSSAPQGVAYPSSVKTVASLLQQPNVTIPDALKDLPGVSLVRDGAWETDLSIRGMSGSNIVTMIDNTRIETATNIAGTLSLLDIHDIERAELIKSPGSVLYGTGAFGGVLHLITRRASFSDQPQMSGELTGEFSSVDGEAGEHAALTWSSDACAMRLSGGYRQAALTMTPLGEIPHSQFHDFNITGAIGVKTFGNQSAYFSYQRSQADDTGIPGGASFSASAAVRYTLARRELFSLEYVIPNPRPDLPLITIRLSHQEIDRNVEVIQNPALTLTPHATHGTTSGQIESQILLPSNQILTIGSEVWQRDLDSRRERINKSTNQITGDLPVPHSHFFSAGIYGQDEWALSPDRLTVTLGARYDWIRINSDEALSPAYVISAGVLQTAPPGQHILWNQTFARDGSWSASGGAAYTLTPAITLTTLVATAFRSPSLEERFDYLSLGSLVRAGNPSLRSEKSVSVNTGLRLHTKSLHLQGDLFYNSLTDLVAYVPGQFEGQDAFIEQNIGDARLYGYELSAEQSLTGWEALSFSIAYVRGENRFDHTDLPHVAPLNGRIESKTSFSPVGTVNIAVAGCAEQKNLAAGEIRTPGYATVDIGLLGNPIVLERFSLTIRTGIQNVFNKLYQNHLSTLRGFMTFEPGRNIFLSATIAL